MTNSIKSILDSLRRSRGISSAGKTVDPFSRYIGYTSLVMSLRPSSKSFDKVIAFDFTLLSANGETVDHTHVSLVSDRQREIARERYADMPEYDGLVKLLFGLDRYYPLDGGGYVSARDCDYWKNIEYPAYPVVYGQVKKLSSGDVLSKEDAENLHEEYRRRYSDVVSFHKTVSGSYRNPSVASGENRYPKTVCAGVIRFAEHVFVWLDETGNAGGVGQTLEDAQSQLRRYADGLSSPSPLPDRFDAYRGRDLLHLMDAFSVMDTDTMNDGWADQPDSSQIGLQFGYFVVSAGPGGIEHRFPHPVGMWAVVGDSGVISYHAHENDAFIFRMALINLCLNGKG